MAMRRKLRSGYSRPANWRIEYEEGPVSDRWVYKWNGTPAADAAWHSFSEAGQASYRFTPLRLQFISAGPRVANSVWRAIVESFGLIEPLLDEGVEELRIRAVDGKLWMWSIWLPEKQAVRLAGLTREALLVALERVNERAAELHAAPGRKPRARRRR
jgi:hypothetical protein